MWHDFSLFPNVEETVLFKSPPVVRKKKHFARICDCKQTEKWQNGKKQIQRTMRRHSCDWAEEKSGTHTGTEKKNQDRMLK